MSRIMPQIHSYMKVKFGQYKQDKTVHHTAKYLHLIFWFTQAIEWIF